MVEGAEYYWGKGVSEVIPFAPELANQGKLLPVFILVMLKRGIEFFYEFFIFNEVGWRNRTSIVKVHHPFEIYVKFVLIDYDQGIPNSVDELFGGCQL